MKRKKRKESKELQQSAVQKTVLVADDSPTIRKIVELCLAEHALEVIPAGTGAEAVEKLATLRPDLVLVDTVMPEPDGYSVCERIKSGAFGPGIAVVLLVDAFEPLDMARLSSCGADGHISKPFEARTLRLMISDQLGIEAPPMVQRPAPAQAAGSSTHGRAGGPSASPFPGLPAAPGHDGPLAPSPDGARLSESDLDALAQRVVRMLAPDVVREVAWEVVPEMSEILIREKMRALPKEELVGSLP